MSVWVCLVGDKGIVKVDPHEAGGTYPLGGTSEADLNVTYNYSLLYRLALRSYLYEHSATASQHVGDALEVGLWKWLEGVSAETSIPVFEAILDQLIPSGVVCRSINDENYWSATPNNAAAAIDLLLSWAKAHPTAVWRASG